MSQRPQILRGALFMIGAALSSPVGCLVATKAGYGTGNGGPDVLGAQIEEPAPAADRQDRSLLPPQADPQTPLEESLGVIGEYRDRGRIRYVGVSNVSVEQVERARQVVSIAAVQNHYNLSERTHEDVVDYCAENGIVFVPYFPFGLFS